MVCTFCGRKVGADSRFCVDCGKPLGTGAASTDAARVPARPRRASSAAPRRGSAELALDRSSTSRRRRSSGATTVSCGWCGETIESGLTYCTQCGRRTDAKLAPAGACPTCGGTIDPEVDSFCATCGTLLARALRADPPARTLLFAQRRREAAPLIAVLDATGATTRVVALEGGLLVVGRSGCDLSFPDDAYLSPRHAELSVVDGALRVRDLGSVNGTWVFVDGVRELTDGDVLLVGSQLLRVEMLDRAASALRGPAGARRIGSETPGHDLARLVQLRADGSSRDVLHLSSGRTVVLGRESGDWLFPYDQTMSSRHVEIRELNGQLELRDLGSRNGVALKVRGETVLVPGQCLLVGDQLLRVESA